jgi:shikimate dehydrogenase
VLRAGLIGFPVEHSRSPAMHNAAFAAAGIAARYELWPTSSDELSDRIAALRDPAILGANVTIPHKIAVMPLLDEIDSSAERVGAVNTIVRRSGRLRGCNTDAEGLARALREAGHAQVAGGVVLGAGGAARAAVVALSDLGAGQIAIAARRADAAVSLVRMLQPVVGRAILEAVSLVETAVLAALQHTDIVINATPIGMANAPGVPLGRESLAALPSHALVVDLIVEPTAWLALANSLGLATTDGLPMLLHQGALAWEWWTAQAAPLDAMRLALGI